MCNVESNLSNFRIDLMLGVQQADSRITLLFLFTFFSNENVLFPRSTRFDLQDFHKESHANIGCLRCTWNAATEECFWKFSKYWREKSHQEIQFSCFYSESDTISVGNAMNELWRKYSNNNNWKLKRSLDVQTGWTVILTDWVNIDIILNYYKTGTYPCGKHFHLENFETRKNGKTQSKLNPICSCNVASIIECLYKQNVPISSQIHFISDKQLMIYVRPVPDTWNLNHTVHPTTFKISISVQPVVWLLA